MYVYIRMYMHMIMYIFANVELNFSEHVAIFNFFANSCNNNEIRNKPCYPFQHYVKNNCCFDDIL